MLVSGVLSTDSNLRQVPSPPEACYILLPLQPSMHSCVRLVLDLAQLPKSRLRPSCFPTMPMLPNTGLVQQWQQGTKGENMTHIR
jgi:hypothetical protein